MMQQAQKLEVRLSLLRFSNEYILVCCLIVRYCKQVTLSLLIRKGTFAEKSSSCQIECISN